MAENQIDRLEIQVQTQAQKANADLDKLVNKLERMSSSLNRLNAGGLKNLANGVDSLGRSVQNMSTVKTADFTRLAKNIEKLGSINQSGINNTANALRQISSALTATNGASSSVQGIADLTKGISKLGNKSVSNAITNLPLLANSMKQFMTVMSSAPNVSQNLIQMTNAMANLASQGSKYNSTIKSMGNAAKNLSRAHNEAYKSNMNFFASLSKLTVGFYILRRAVRAALEPIQKAMDFGETINLFETSFKKIGMEAAEESGLEWGSTAADAFALEFVDRAQSFNDKITKALSLDPNMTMQYQAIFAQMANAFGLATKTVNNFSESFTLLGLDIASFFNTDVEEAMVKLRAGLAGETEPLRRLGVDITEATLKMTAMKYGIEGTVSKMSQAAKTQLRWLAIMDQTETVFGDMAKTIQSPANQARIMQQQMENLSRTLGTIFLPIITKVLPYVNAFFIALQRLASVIAGAMGYELPDYTGSDIYQDVTGDITGIGDAAGESNNEVKKLQKSLASFDSLNILSSGSGSSKGSDVGGGFPVLDDAIAQRTDSYMKKFNDELAKMSNSSNEIADKISGFLNEIAEKASPTTTALKNLWNNGLSNFMGFYANGVKDFYNNFLVPVGSWVIGKGLPDLVNTINDFSDNIDLIDLSRAFGNLWDSLAPFAINVGTGFVSFVDAITEMLTPVVNNTISDFADGINGFTTAIGLIPEDTAIAIGGAIAGIATAFLLYKGAKTAVKVIDSLNVSFNGMLTAIKAHPVLAIATAVTAIASAFIALDKAKFNRSEIGLYIQELDKLIQRSKDFNEETKEMLENHAERKSDIEAEYGAVQILADKYFDLADKASLTNAEQELLKSYAEELIKKVPELSELIDEQTGAYKGTKDEIEALIEKTKEYYLVQAAQESLVETAKAMYEAEKNLKDLEDERQAVVDLLAEKQTAYNDTVKTAETNMHGATEEQKQAALKAIELSAEISKLEGVQDDLDGQITTTRKSQKKLNDEFDYAADYIKTYSDTAGVEMPKVETSVNTALKNIYKTVSNFKLPNLSITTDVLYKLSGISGDDPLGIIKPEYKVKGYAGGGHPNTGEFFMARENGLTEYVGRMGGKTTVANNADISAGIEEAAYRGYMRAVIETRSMSNSAPVVEVPLYLDGEELARGIYNGKQSYEGRMNPVRVGG
jgi:hypothetical protein